MTRKGPDLRQMTVVYSIFDLKVSRQSSANRATRKDGPLEELNEMLDH
jgi:hypothetical protein